MDTSPFSDSAPQTVDPAQLSSPSDIGVIPDPSDATRPRETETSAYRSAPSDASRGGETWMDFLRGDDGPSESSRGSLANPEAAQQADTSRLVDRKRRLNVSEPSGRRGGYRSSSSQARTELPTPGTSSSNAIDLTGTSPERPAPPPGASQSQDGQGRRESDIMIPTWQPDSDVSNCPVCDAQFTFWYRKHHCRKCGRVVCAACSPHRITIPRQYIVRAPEEIQMSQGGNLIDLTADSDTDQPSASHTYNPALGGGEEVRVCNPCVPDPNFSPPPQDIQSRFPDFFSAGFNDSSAPLQYTPLSPGGRSRNFTFDSQGFSRLGPSMSGHRPSLSDVSSRLHHSDGGGGARTRGVGFGLPSNSSSHEAGRSPYSYPHHPGSSLPFLQHTRAARPHLAASSTSTRTRGFPPGGLASSYQPTPPPPPRRVVPEEDECPICHEELPPKGPDGSTAQREAHIEDCIAANFAGRSAPSNATATATPGSGTPGSMTSARASPAGTPPVPGVVMAEGSARGRRRATHGMLRYRASEKDCVDERGEPQECIICFEEFAVGDEMGRLECFCKFHRACIRSWWDTKGDGSCPTHQGSVTLG